MSKLAIRLLTLAMLSLTLAAAPVVTAVYAAPDNDPPPPQKKKKSSEARPGIEQTAFADGYRAAYATIYDRHDYSSAITQLKALGRDDTAALARFDRTLYRFEKQVGHRAQLLGPGARCTPGIERGVAFANPARLT